jgi:hypothetical protein
MAQILSLLICGTGVTNNKLANDYKVNIPTSKFKITIIFSILKDFLLFKLNQL